MPPPSTAASLPSPRLLRALVAAALPSWLAGCGPGTPAFVPPPPPEVTVATPVQQEVPRELVATGTTRAVRNVAVRPRVSGIVVTRHVEGGRTVAAGELLFTIDEQPFRIVVEQRRAELAAAEAELRLAEATLERTQKAIAGDAAARIQLDRAVAARDDALASRDLARAALAAAELDLAWTRVEAPGAGRLGVEVVDPGALVGPQTVLATLVDDSTIYATFQLDERQLALVSRGNRTPWPTAGDGAGTGDGGGLELEMALGGETGWPHRGRIDRRDNTVDPATGTMTLEAVFDNAAAALLPGRFCRVRIALGAERLWTVPAVAVLRDPEGSYVLVVGEDGIVQRRGVEPAGLVGEQRGLRSGLSGGEHVVVNGVQRARVGMPVRPQERPAAKTPATPAAGAASRR